MLLPLCKPSSTYAQRRVRRDHVEYKVKMAFAKELAKSFKVELATASAILIGIGAAIGYSVAKKTP